jgi:hypothetical protein
MARFDQLRQYKLTLPHLVDIKISEEYSSPGEKDGKERQRVEYHPSPDTDDRSFWGVPERLLPRGSRREGDAELVGLTGRSC